MTTTHIYQLDDITLDLGDLGIWPAVVTGTVSESGLFGPGEGYIKATVERVMVYTPTSNFGLEATALVQPAALASLRERLEEEHEKRGVA